MNEKEFYEVLGSKIASLRESSGLRSKDVAEFIDVSPSVISEAEKGKKLSMWRAYQIFDMLGYNLLEPAQKKTA